MIFEQRNTRGLLRGVVRRLTTDRALEEDLIQEGIIHLWLRERDCPSQRQSWYIQSCRLHLQNLLRKGRSVDGGKRRQTVGPLVEFETQQDVETTLDDTFLSLICARDLVDELGKWLTPAEKQILNLVQESLSLREIGRRLNLSHTSVIRHRRNIAAIGEWLRAFGPLTKDQKKDASHPSEHLIVNADTRRSPGQTGRSTSPNKFFRLDKP